MTTMTAGTEPQTLAGQYVVTTQGTAKLKAAVTLAASTLDFPNAQINVLDEHHQHTISQPGSDEPRSIPRSHSMCQFVIDGAAPLIVGDVRADSRFAALPGVAAGLLGSYLGIPLARGVASSPATLCVLDIERRAITPGHLNRLQQFGDIVNEHLDHMRLRTEQDIEQLTRAVADGKVLPWYQPIVDLRTGAVAAYEARARWAQPSGVVLEDAGLVPLGECGELVLDLDRAVLRRAFADLAQARRTSPDLRIAVNISNRHLDTPDAVREICYATIDADLPPSAIDLEVVETADFEDEDLARGAVTQLRGYGFGVVLDEFGSGWSSLDWVLRLPVSSIKLDRVAATALGTPIGEAVARAMVGLSAEVGVHADVDGITTAEQAELMRALGYRHGQGELWAASAPMAASALAS